MHSVSWLLLAVLPLSAEQDWRAVMRESIDRLDASDQKMQDFGYLRRNVRKEFNSDGSLKSQQTYTLRRLLSDGEMVNRLVERNGKPVSTEEAAQYEEEMREKTMGKPIGARRQDAAWIQELPDALTYTLIGEEVVQGRKVWVLACAPTPGYKARSVRARVLEKMKGRVWIDQSGKDLVKADGEVFETVSIGFGVLGKIEKGTRVNLDRAPVDAGTWFTHHFQVRFAVKIMLVRNILQEIVSEYSNFQPRSALLAR